MTSARETQGERDAYRDGMVDARLDEFDQHFDTINGSIADTATALVKLVASIEGLRRDFTDAQVIREKYIPQIEKLTSDAVGTRTVAAALKEQESEARSGWERWREKLGWAAGIVALGFIAFDHFN